MTSTQLAEITICFKIPGFDYYFAQAVDTIRRYDDALCQLSDQLESPPLGSDKLTLTLKGPRLPADPNEILPRFSKVGILKLEGTW